jgi:hypothetical protein
LEEAHEAADDLAGFAEMGKNSKAREAALEMTRQ